MRGIKITLDEPVITALDAQAAMLNVSRAEVIRRCISDAGAAGSITPDKYNDMVRRAYAFTGGGIDRRQFESLVAFLFRELHLASTQP